VKKIISKLLILTLLISFVPTGFANAEAQATNKDNYVKTSTNELIKLKSFEFDEEKEVQNVTVEILNNNTNSSPTEEEFEMVLETDQFGDTNATLIDSEGNKIELNEEEFQTFALPLAPLVISFLAKNTLKAAIKKYGKQSLTTLVKQGEPVARAVAKKLGYRELGDISHGAKVYQRASGKGPKFITRDKDGHVGGAWKGANTIKDLGSNKTRSGTYDIELNWIAK
jgi:Novel toxin 21